MPRYFFDTIIASERVPDHHGRELESDAAAGEWALEEITELLGTRTGAKLEPYNCAIEVKDAQTRLLFKVPFYRHDCAWSA